MPDDSTPKCSYTRSVRTKLGRAWAVQQGIDPDKTRSRIHCPDPVCREIDGLPFCRVHHKVSSYDWRKHTTKGKRHKHNPPGTSTKYKIDPYYDSAAWRALRLDVLKRDNHVCQYCGARAHQADHIVPRKRGGADTLTNLVACCMTCNKTAGGKLFPSVEAKRQYIRKNRGLAPARPTSLLNNWHREIRHELENTPSSD